MEGQISVYEYLDSIQVPHIIIPAVHYEVPKQIYRATKNYENAQKRIFPGVGEYQIPEISPALYHPCEFIGFNYAKGCKDRAGKGVHFFLDDYQFNRVWNDPDKYLPMLRQFRCVLSPDFSLYTDFPRALQIYNHYRKHWLAAYWQENGIHVIPTVCWSDESSFEWCFDGEPIGGAVAVSAIGTQMRREDKEAFMVGYNEMMDRLHPEVVLFYGRVPDGCKGNIVEIPAFQDKFGKKG